MEDGGLQQSVSQSVMVVGSRENAYRIRDGGGGGGYNVLLFDKDAASEDGYTDHFDDVL